MNRRHEKRWASATERARVAADLLAEAESLTETAALATPADVAREHRPPPISLELPRTAISAPVASPALPPSPSPRPVSAAPVDPDAALALLDRALERAPEDAALLLRRAATLTATGRYAAAQRDIEGVLRVDPAHVEALSALGLVLSRKGRWADAIPHLRRVAELDADRAAAWHCLGEALNHVDDLDGALAAYERATTLQPLHTRALYGLGVVLDRLNRPEEATRMYRRSREAAGR
jgi:tetratricopeptide (TPR) repeat protein